ncbi:conjugal transfer protein TraG N-terminal domain-containing protein [Erwinia tracheiphila]|uniref:conjugal transfer protein TraG N-terminal domain-containing protein n=1 Tax=Erwinia tracheiphila TaxID=65700 RepID=UPI001E5A3040|nr:conjugal transfer protein TraG N-terminal domain-containing protein [Erwinia tracheiphila]
MVDISTIKFDSSRAKQCGVSVPTPQNSGYKGLVNDFDGRTAEVPVWWYLLHMMSKGTTQAMIASIPCGTQLRQMRFDVQNTKLRDPVLLQEVQDFANQCYSRAYFRLKNSNSQLSDATINSVGWIGSDYFLNTSGYYDYYTAMTPRSQWPYDSARDSGYPDTGQGGYPTCKTWWSDGSSGLRQRVLASFSEDTRKEMQRQFPGTQWETLALQWLVSPRNAGLSGGGTTYAVGSADNTTGVAGNLTRLTSTIGLGLKQAEALPGFDALKQALPMIQALLQMMIITVIPVLMMFSAYEPKTIVTISFAQFALQFITFWWELAGWLDDRLITILYDNMAEQGIANSSIPFAGFFSSTSDGWMMNVVLGMMYAVFPAFWVGMLGWAGARIGSMASHMADGAKISMDAGAEAGKKAQGMAIDSATGGVKGAMK